MIAGHARGRVGMAVLALSLFAVHMPSAVAAEEVPASLSDLRATEKAVTATLVIRGDKAVVVDPKSVKASVGGTDSKVDVEPPAKQTRSTMLVIDTSKSMGAAGMATVRTAVEDFLAAVPADVKVGVVSFANTSGVDVAPTTDRAKVRREVSSFVASGETALYAGVQDAVKALGTNGERSIVLLSDGADTVSELEGGRALARSQRNAALKALSKGKVRAEVVAFNSPESNGKVLQQFAEAGGGSVVSASDRPAVADAFTAAARAFKSQALITIQRPAGVTGVRDVVVTGTASGASFTARGTVDLGDTAPLPSATPSPVAAGPPSATPPQMASVASPMVLIPATAIVGLGLFFLMVAFMSPVFRSRRKERVSAIEAYGFGRAHSTGSATTSATAMSAQLVEIGDRVMAGRESTTRTLVLIDRADLPWRAGEWFVLRIIAVLVALAAALLVLRSHLLVALVVGLVAGLFLPPLILRYLAQRRSRRFEAVLPDVLMLVATSLSSGFSLLQALDAVAKDAPEPAAKEFSRALAEARIGADVSDALDHLAVRMDSENMRWATMAIRIQREVGGNLAETLRTTAATLREREMLRRQVRALSAEGRLSAYILIAMPFLLLGYSLLVNYEYISLLWTTLFGILMSIAGLVALVIGIFWMRNVVKIEV